MLPASYVHPLKLKALGIIESVQLKAVKSGGNIAAISNDL